MKLFLLGLLIGVCTLVRAAPPANAPKISLYYESLCPYCHEFFIHQLAPAHAKLSKHVVFELVPYGNVRVTHESGANVFHCQHGEPECYGNRVQACAIEHLKATPDTSFAYVNCSFSATNFRDTHSNAEKCAHELKLDWTKIKACTDGAEGEKLIEANWHKTDSLVPKKTSVPWITVNGVHNNDVQSNARSHLINYLCNHYLAGQNVAECNA